MIVRLIVGFAVDDPGLEEMVNEVVPVTATFNVPDCEAIVVVLPR